MTGGRRDEPPRTAVNGGEFILSLLQKPQLQTHTQPSQQIVIDPAVAAVGPSVHYVAPSPAPSPSPWSSSSNTQDPAYGHTWTNFSTNPTTPIPPHLLGLPRSYWNNPSPVYANNDHNQQRLGFTGNNIGATSSRGPENVHNLEPPQQKIVFGSLNQNWQLNNVTKEHDLSNGFDRNRQFGYANHQHDDNTRGNYRSTETKVMRSQPPPGFLKRKEEDDRGRRFTNEDVTLPQRLGLNGQLDKHGPSPGSKLLLASQRAVEESLRLVEGDVDNVEDLSRQIVESLLLEGEANGKDKKYHRDKDIRSDNRGQNVLSYGMRIRYSKRPCRRDILRLNAHFHAIYESLIPPEEVKANQLRLFTHLEKLVYKEWPEARLYVYGSCGNSFGVSKSDVDVCLSFQGTEINKSEVLLKLADILESDNFQNVQALTRARVPIVKLMHPETGISCDICINNLLAVVNTKLLRDYAQIDGRLRQLAFIVKHWAKSRGVNETYQGTLSSYAYVLMCIHFLQQRRPAILPCLQMMEPTYSEIIDGTEYAFYDRVERLYNYGSQNKETIAELVWGFFNYWAYRHDYTKDAISVRTGGIISKHDKDWTRRVGNDRHLICIEDPFEITHDLGRVVDKFSIKVLREEFERAAEVMQFDPNPCVTLFEPYLHTST